MAQGRSFPYREVRSEFAGKAASEAEPVVKGEDLSRTEVQTSQSVSDPSSLPIVSSSGGVGVRGKEKSAPKRYPQEFALYPAFRRLCDEIRRELGRIYAFLIDDVVSDEGAEVVVEVEELLEQLYAYPYGEGECLKRIVVAVQSQVNNTRWERHHVEFLNDVVRFLRVRYLVDEAAVKACYDFMKSHELNEFRGTICAPQVLKRYRIEEVNDDVASRRDKP